MMAHRIDIEMKRTVDGSQWQFRLVSKDGHRISPQAVVDAVAEYFMLDDPHAFEAISDPLQDPDLH